MARTKEEILAEITEQFPEVMVFDPDANGVTFRQAIQAMESYHKEKLREELHMFRQFYNKRYLNLPYLKESETNYVDIDDYLNSR